MPTAGNEVIQIYLATIASTESIDEPGIMALIMEADVVVQFTLLVLVAMSLLCWIIIFNKLATDPPPRSTDAMVLRDKPVSPASQSSDLPFFNRRARSCSNTVRPGPIPVSRKSSASIAATRLGTEPIPRSSR